MPAASLPSLKREALLSMNSAYGQTSSRSDASTIIEAAIVSDSPRSRPHGQPFGQLLRRGG